ncbi:MAG: hypothetical protein HKP19_14585 [Xanthomonadales bacterium]|nr:hypothetical protein [Xanthomonadales bacterium]
MMRLFLTTLALCGSIFLAESAMSNGTDDLDVDYAEHLPLVDRGTFLDITRHGDSYVAVGERGHIVLSRDGKSWTQAEVVPTRATLTTVSDSGGRLWAGGHDAVILTSGDGGTTWTRLFFDTERQQAVMDIYFTDQNNGVAIGSYGLYLKTMDGGETWEDITIDEEGGYHLNAMLRFDDGRRLIAGEAGYSYRSFDDGETWERLDLPYLGSMWGALQTSNDCVLFFGLRGHTLRSCDFGSTWTEVETGTESSISGGAAYDGQFLLAANSGTLLVREGNRDWQQIIHSSGVDFAAAIATDDGRFLLAGENGIFEFPESVAEGRDND